MTIKIFDLEDFTTFCTIFNNKQTLADAIILRSELRCFLQIRELGITEEEKRGKEIHHIISKSYLKTSLGISKELADKYADSLPLNKAHANDLEHAADHYLSALINMRLGKGYENDSSAVNAVLGMKGPSIFNSKTLEINITEPTFKALLKKMKSDQELLDAAEKDKLSSESGVEVMNILGDGTIREYTIKEIIEKGILSDPYVRELLKEGTLGRADGVGKDGGVWVVKKKTKISAPSTKSPGKEHKKCSTKLPVSSSGKVEDVSLQKLMNLLERREARRLIIDVETGDHTIVTSRAGAAAVIAKWFPEYKNVDNIDKALSYSFKRKTEECKRGTNGLLSLNNVDGDKTKRSFRTYFIPEDFPEKIKGFSKEKTKKMFNAAFATVPSEYRYLIK